MSINFSKFKKTTLFVLYVIGFIFAFTSSIPAYVNSSFLASLTSQQSIGVFYTVSAIFSLISLLYIPKLLKKYGNYKVTLILSILYFFNFLGIALISNIFFVLFCFVLSGAFASVLYFNFDIFVEHNSTDEKTGEIRSIYLTCINFAWLFSPWLAGIIVQEFSYRTIYLLVALILVPVIFIILFKLKNYKDREYMAFNFFETVKSLKGNKNITNIIIAGFLLQFFYSWMVVYSPIYLNQVVGFNWIISGLIFSIALVPFVVVQVPLGYLADKKIGEKEMLIVGFILMGVFTIIIPLIHGNSFLLWTIILFMGRLGAAIVEIMADTYFFKNITDKNLNVINLYRTVSPFAYIIGPISASIIMIFLPFSSIFYILGFLMIISVQYVWVIKDTK